MVEVKGFKKWAFPLVVVMMNSIAACGIARFLEGFLEAASAFTWPPFSFQFAGVGLERFFRCAVILLRYWLSCCSGCTPASGS